MNFLNPLCHARIIICMLLVVSIKFGGHTCVDLTKSVHESDLKNCPLPNDTALTAYSPEADDYELCDATIEKDKYKWEYIQCEPISLRTFFASIRTKDWTPESRFNTMFSLVMLVNLAHMLVLVVEVLAISNRGGNANGGATWSLLGLESLSYVGQMLVVYLCYIRWHNMSTFGAGERPFFFAAIMLFLLSEMFFFTEILFRLMFLEKYQVKLGNERAQQTGTQRSQKYIVTKPSDQMKDVESEPKSAKVKLFEQEMFSSSESSC